VDGGRRQGARRLLLALWQRGVGVEEPHRSPREGSAEPLSVQRDLPARTDTGPAARWGGVATEVVKVGRTASVGAGVSCNQHGPVCCPGSVNAGTLPEGRPSGRTCGCCHRPPAGRARDCIPRVGGWRDARPVTWCGRGERELRQGERGEPLMRGVGCARRRAARRAVSTAGGDVLAAPLFNNGPPGVGARRLKLTTCEGRPGAGRLRLEGYRRVIRGVASTRTTRSSFDGGRPVLQGASAGAGGHSVGHLGGRPHRGPLTARARAGWRIPGARSSVTPEEHCGAWRPADG